MGKKLNSYRKKTDKKQSFRHTRITRSQFQQLSHKSIDIVSLEAFDTHIHA